MKAIAYRLKSTLLRFFLITLAVVLPTLAHAQTTGDSQSVKALTSNPSGALVVLRASGLFAIDGGTSTEIPLPTSDAGAQPTSLAKGADESIYLAGPGLGVWRYNSANNS